MKRFISLILTITLVLSLCACTYTGSNTKITIGVLSPVTTLDPVKATSDSEKIVSANCFEGLLRLDSDGNINLGGAVGYSVSSDNLTYIFKLNTSAKWYVPDDTAKALKNTEYSVEVTATDYVYGFKRYMSANKAHLSNVKNVSATDTYTLAVNLEKPDIDFLYKLAVLPLYPCNEKIADALGGKLFSSAGYTPCNGTYYVNESAKSETLLERNTNYSGNVHIANRFISLYTTGSAETVQKRFGNKTYDLYISPSISYTDVVVPTQRYISTVWGLAFNTSTFVGENPALRSILLSSVYRGHIEKPYFALSDTYNIIPDTFLVKESKYKSFGPENLSYVYDPEAGKAMLSVLTDEIGHTTYTVDFFVPAPMQDSAEIMIQLWEKTYGNAFSFTLTTFELSETETVATEGSYDIAILPLSPEFNTAYGMLESLCGAPCFAEKSDFLKSYDTLPDEKTIAEDFKNAEKYIVEQGIFIPLFTSSNDIYSVSELSGAYAVDGGEILYLHAGTKPEEK